jgi:hypothetical protein
VQLQAAETAALETEMESAEMGSVLQMFLPAQLPPLHLMGQQSKELAAQAGAGCRLDTNYACNLRIALDGHPRQWRRRARHIGYYTLDTPITCFRLHICARQLQPPCKNLLWMEGRGGTIFPFRHARKCYLLCERAMFVPFVEACKAL